MITHFKTTIGLGLLGFFLLSMINGLSSPPRAIAPYLNGVFTEITPGLGGSWYLEETLDKIEIAAPLKIIELPHSEEVLILCKTGRVWQVNLQTQTQSLVLDISDRTLNYSEAGATSLAIHPKFGQAGYIDKQLLYIFYRYKPDSDPELPDDLGYNRLSVFKWDDSTQQFDSHSEKILIQQFDRSLWHNGGGLFFEDGLLYLALGDEGANEYRDTSNQRLDGGLFSGLLRIDIDNDTSRSHPIRRQPLSNDTIPYQWKDTSFTRGYSIPNDNPWQSEAGKVLEEFVAIGIRSPYSTHFDTVAKKIWISDVGSNRREEINQVEIGDNLQWNYLEGESWAGNRPDSIIGNEKKPVFHYGNELGSCIIGGGIYRGDKFIHLNGRYLFADYVSHKIMALQTNINAVPEAEVLLTDFGPEPVDLHQYSSISGLHYLSNGDILVTVIVWPFTEGGKILHLRQRAAIPDPPTKLSELGVFTNLESLEVIDGIFPYEVNAPLWSDRAVKRRWMAIPNDGQFNQEHEQIQFSMEEDWKFPEGTVFIKHFDMPVSLTDPSQLTKLETRFFIMGKNNTAYGLTYKWNKAQTDAFLQLEKTATNYDIYENGEVVATQQWDFPSRDQCMSCHNSNANFVLGVKTHQLNSSIFYPKSGIEENQLKYLSNHNIINHDYDNSNSYPKAYNLYDNFASLDVKIQSYLDANCASCHRLGGVTGITMDLRFHTPLHLKNIIELPTQSQSSSHNNLIVEPGNHRQSELWIRDQSEDDNRMPPIATNLVNQDYIQTLADWIDGLGEEDIIIKNFITFPNPSSGWMTMRVNGKWSLPLQIEVHSMDGQLVHSEEQNTHDIHLGLQRVGAGVFMLSVKDTAGNQHTQSIMIQ